MIDLFLQQLMNQYDDILVYLSLIICNPLLMDLVLDPAQELSE